jgi:hypothetical protein
MIQMTWKEACIVCSVWIKEALGIDITPEQFFNLSPTGELWHVFYYMSIATGE